MALMYVLHKFNHLPRWKKFVVVMWSTMKNPGGFIWRWLDFIQEFNLTVIHQAVKHNLNADLISPARHMSEPNPSNEGTITHNTADVYRLPWLSCEIHPDPEHFTPHHVQVECDPWLNCIGILQAIRAWNAVARP